MDLKSPNLPIEPLKLDDNISVWSEMNETAVRYKCLSLGEGAPAYPPPKFLRDFMIEAIDAGHNQYCRTFGSLPLVEQIAQRYGPQLNREINPGKEILVSTGANTAIGSLIAALVNPGDELLLFEPTFPMYIDHLQMSGGNLKTVPLLPDQNGDWKFDPEMLKQALTQNTKMLILNTPHNPTGKCFTLEEQMEITEILKDYPNCVVMADEVYDYLTFDGLQHVPFASIGDNWHRTITVYSGGKLLNATGWKVGWAIGPEQILRLSCVINNTSVYCTNHPAQIAMSKALPLVEKEGHVKQQVALFEEVRNYLQTEVQEMSLPWTPLPCYSGYFLMADIRKCKHLVPSLYLENHEYENSEPKIVKNNLYMPLKGPNDTKRIPLDLAFARWMAKENGVTMMPGSFFYHKNSPYINDGYVRLAICKNIESVRQVCKRLRQIKF